MGPAVVEALIRVQMNHAMQETNFSVARYGRREHPIVILWPAYFQHMRYSVFCSRGNQAATTNSNSGMFILSMAGIKPGRVKYDSNPKIKQ